MVVDFFCEAIFAKKKIKYGKNIGNKNNWCFKVQVV